MALTGEGLLMEALHLGDSQAALFKNSSSRIAIVLASRRRKPSTYTGGTNQDGRNHDRDNGELVAGQQLTSPSVFLDHWALRIVSDNLALGERLRRVLEARKGTLVVSWANIAEFSALDQRAARQAEEFLDRQLPRLFFLDFNAFDVIRRESELLAGGPPLPPHADLERLVVGLRPAGVRPITCIGMLTEVSGQRLKSTDRMKGMFVERTSSLRAEYLDDKEFRTLVDQSLRGQPAPRGTSIILREVVAGLMRDKTSVITPNDGLDFFHTIVPVAYCDFVLLDGKWRDQVERVRTRLDRAGARFPLATVFSGAEAIEKLIEGLETFERT